MIEERIFKLKNEVEDHYVIITELRCEPGSMDVLKCDLYNRDTGEKMEIDHGRVDQIIKMFQELQKESDDLWGSFCLK